jgi:hypothetical protein
MNVLTDFHHAGLLNSLIMLFEDRMGGNVYRPIGLDWYEQGFWKIYDHPDTANQYLSFDQGYRPKDGSPPLNLLQEVHNAPMLQKDVFYCRDIDSDQVNKAITLETFKAMPIDIVIASIPAHIEPFQRLIREHKPKAKLIFQIGNAWSIEAGSVQNVMASAIVNNVPDNINFVEYHQEFDQKIFKHVQPNNQNIITSLINVHHDMPDYNLFLELDTKMTHWNFLSYGGQGRDGSMGGAHKVATAIRESRFIWHVKAGGDGYGHILFNTAAMGRPTIVKKHYYIGKLGEKLLIDGETCIDIDGLGHDGIIKKIEYFNKPDRYAAMCRAVFKNFREQVNFNKDYEKIKQFIEGLK